jgi:hypothetical protein
LEFLGTWSGPAAESARVKHLQHAVGRLPESHKGGLRRYYVALVALTLDVLAISLPPLNWETVGDSDTHTVLLDNLPT